MREGGMRMGKEGKHDGREGGKRSEGVREEKMNGGEGGREKMRELKKEGL